MDSTLLDSLKKAKDFAAGANNIQLQSALLDVYQDVLNLLDENKDLRLKVEELTNNKLIENELKFEGSFYYREDEGPYCTRCWDADQKLITVLKSPRPLQRVGQHRCPNCETITN